MRTQVNPVAETTSAPTTSEFVRPEVKTPEHRQEPMPERSKESFLTLLLRALSAWHA